MTLITTFFDRYASRYLDCDAEKLPPFFDPPCMIIDSENGKVFEEREVLLDYLDRALALLKEAEIASIEKDVIAEHRLDAASRLCTLSYRLLDRRQRVWRAFDYHYIVVGGADDWRIKVAKIGDIRVGG